MPSVVFPYTPETESGAFASAALGLHGAVKWGRRFSGLAEPTLIGNFMTAQYQGFAQPTPARSVLEAIMPCENAQLFDEMKKWEWRSHVALSIPARIAVTSTEVETQKGVLWANIEAPGYAPAPGLFFGTGAPETAQSPSLVSWVMDAQQSPMTRITLRDVTGSAPDRHVEMRVPNVLPALALEADASEKVSHGTTDKEEFADFASGVIGLGVVAVGLGMRQVREQMPLDPAHGLLVVRALEKISALVARPEVDLCGRDRRPQFKDGLLAVRALARELRKTLDRPELTGRDPIQ